MPTSRSQDRPPQPLTTTFDPSPLPPPPPQPYAFRPSASQDQDEEPDLEDEQEHLGDLRQRHLATRTTLRGVRTNIQPLQKDLIESMAFAADRTRIFLSERNIVLPPDIVKAFNNIDVLREKLSILEASYEETERKYTDQEIQIDRKEARFVDHLSAKFASLNVSARIPGQNVSSPIDHCAQKVPNAKFKDFRSFGDLKDVQVDEWLDEIIAGSALQKAQQKAWDRDSNLSSEEYWTRFSRIRLIESATVIVPDSRPMPLTVDSATFNDLLKSVSAPEPPDISPTIRLGDLGDISSADAETTNSSEKQKSVSTVEGLGSCCCPHYQKSSSALSTSLAAEEPAREEVSRSSDHETPQPQQSKTSLPEFLSSRRLSRRPQNRPRISSAHTIPYARHRRSFPLDEICRLPWPNSLSHRH